MTKNPDDIAHFIATREWDMQARLEVTCAEFQLFGEARVRSLLSEEEPSEIQEEARRALAHADTQWGTHNEDVSLATFAASVRFVLNWLENDEQDNELAA